MSAYQVASTARRARGGDAFAALTDDHRSTVVPGGVQHAYLRGQSATMCGLPASALHTFDEAIGFPFQSSGHPCVTCLDAVA